MRRPPPFTTTPPVSYLAVVDANHVLPKTYEWNAAIERTFGKADVLTVTYLGAAARKLMRTDMLLRPKPQLSSIRAIDSDVWSVAGKRRPQSAVSNRRTALGATGSEAPVLRICPPDISD
jgi:hypothetical protein